MPNRMLIAVAAMSAIAFTSVANAAISAIGPFTGTLSETWESETFYNYDEPGGPGGVDYLPNPSEIMGGAASISSPVMAVFEPSAGATWNMTSNGFAQPSDGVKGMGLNDYGQTATITFDSPIMDFGAYWGARKDGATAGTVTVNFSDGSSDSFTYNRPNADGVLEWHGWHSTIGITQISYSGDIVAIDGLQANPVPEPASLGLLALGGLLLARRRRG